MKAFHRLRIEPRIDGTALLVLYHLCWRHNDTQGVAWPSIAGMRDDLHLEERTLMYAINRLLTARLIRRTKGGGRGRTTRYSLRFLDAARVDPSGTNPIIWRTKHCNPHHPLGKETVQPIAVIETENSETHFHKHRNPFPQTVKPIAHEKKEKNKRSEPTRASKGAGGARALTADEAVDAALAKKQSTARQD